MRKQISVTVESISILKSKDTIKFLVNDRTIGVVPRTQHEHVWESGFFDAKGNQMFCVCDGKLKRIYGKADELFFDTVSVEEYQALTETFEG